MAEIMEPAIHRGEVGATIREKVFTDVDYADDVSLLAKMARVLLPSLNQTMWQHSFDQALSTASGNESEVVEAFTYLAYILCLLAQANRRSSPESSSPDFAYSLLGIKLPELYR